MGLLSQINTFTGTMDLVKYMKDTRNALSKAERFAADATEEISDVLNSVVSYMWFLYVLGIVVGVVILYFAVRTALKVSDGQEPIMVILHVGLALLAPPLYLIVGLIILNTRK